MIAIIMYHCVGINIGINIGIKHKKILPPYKSRTLRILPSPFIGREEEIGTIMKMLDFDRSPPIQIVSVYGPPAAGKSTLVIHVGHKIAEMGTHVHYVNIAETPTIQALCVRILSSARIEIASNISESDARDTLREWIRKLEDETLLILDDCDPHLSDPVLKEQFQNMVDEFQQHSKEIKLLTTSQHLTALSLNQFKSLRVPYLSTKDAFALFGHLTSIKNTTQIKLICELVENVPLALKIIATQLNQEWQICDIECIISQLKSDPLNVLRPEELSSKNTLQASINLAYKYLRPHCQKCGQYLTIFRGSFTEEAAVSILPEESAVTKKCIDMLIKCSLLEWYRPYKESVKRFHFHRLIWNFFKAKHLEVDEIMTISSRYVVYYAVFLKNTFTHMHCSPCVHTNVITDLNLESHNVFLFWSILRNYSGISLDVAIKAAYTIENFRFMENGLQLLQSLLEAIDNVPVQAIPEDKTVDVLEAYNTLITEVNVALQMDPEIPVCSMWIMNSAFLFSISNSFAIPKPSSKIFLQMLKRDERVEQLHRHLGEREYECTHCVGRMIFSMLLHHCRCNYVHYTCRRVWEYWIKGYLVKSLSAFCERCDDNPHSLCKGCSDSSILGLKHYDLRVHEKAIHYLELARKETPKNDCQARKIVIIMALYSIYTSRGEMKKAEKVARRLPIEFGSDIACYSSVYKYFILPFYVQLGRADSVQSLVSILLDKNLKCKEKEYLIVSRKSYADWLKYPWEKDWTCTEGFPRICSPKHRRQLLKSEPLLCGVLRSDSYTELLPNTELLPWPNDLILNITVTVTKHNITERETQ